MNREYKRLGKRLLLPAALAMGCVTLDLAAQEASGTSSDQSFNIERFRLAIDDGGVLDVEAGTVPGDPRHFNLAFWSGVSDDPLVINQVNEDGSLTRVGALVHRRVGGGLVGAFGITPWLELGVHVPLVIYQKSDVELQDISLATDIQQHGLGDPMLYPKVQLLRAARHGVDLSFIPAFAIRFGGAQSYLGEQGASFEPTVAVSKGTGSLKLAANLGYRVRKSSELLDLTVDDELFARLGGSWSFAGNKSNLPLEAGLTLSTALSTVAAFQNTNTSPLEAVAHAAYDVSGPLELVLAGGVGLNQGFGTPDWRMLLAMRFDANAEPRVNKDPDNDGIVGEADGCPNDPEDMDRWQDENGCPEPDNDSDGVLDRDDDCPFEPELKNGYKDDDGCPEKDTDNDRIVDGLDQCPEDSEDFDKFNDQDGCPEPDNDGDKIVDLADKCPNDAEDPDGLDDNDGCPELDVDNDGIPDTRDQCPRKEEVYNGKKDDDGCPDLPVSRVRMGEGRIELLEKVYFDTNKATVKPTSMGVIKDLTAILKANKQITKLRIAGHTDSDAGDDFNLKLSQRRVDEVKRLLIQAGIAPERLEAVGYGETRPMVPNDTPENKAKNRRVEMIIIEVDGVSVEETTTIENANPAEPDGTP